MESDGTDLSNLIVYPKAETIAYHVSAFFMPNEITCAVLFLRSHHGELEVFGCEVTNASFFSLPKGLTNPNEEHIDAAVRELREETGIVVSSNELVDCGIWDYIPNKKQMHVFRYNGINEPNVNQCVCESYFTDKRTGRKQPEVCSFAWINAQEMFDHFNHNQAVVLEKVLESLGEV